LVKSHNEYTLVYKPHGKHYVRPVRKCYEAFVRVGDAQGLQAMVNMAFQGTLDGHTPDPAYKYAARLYPYPNKILVKLTHKLKAGVQPQPQTPVPQLVTTGV
jgi:hypothetical protein